MLRNSQCNEKGFINYLELSRQTAFHEAGHAAAIHLGNQRKRLPALFFQIHTSRSECLPHPLSARIEGGRLFSDLGMVTAGGDFAGDEQPFDGSLQMACEADVINLMVGPLTEAKYVAIRDQESFNLELLSPQALLNYGGSHDMEQVAIYLQRFIHSPQQRAIKLKHLFAEAFRFIQQPDHWRSITGLARHLLHSADSVISCEQACQILDNPPQYPRIDWL